MSAIFKDERLSGLEGEADPQRGRVVLGDQLEEAPDIDVVRVDVVSSDGKSHAQKLGGERGLLRAHLAGQHTARARCMGGEQRLRLRAAKEAHGRAMEL